MTDISEKHPPHDHERTDVQARVLVWMALALALFVLASIPLMIACFKFFQWKDQSREVLSPLAINEQPPAPTLQPVPALELNEYRRQQRELLGDYAWIDRQQKIVRIPIGEATRLLLERGLPKAPPQPAVPPGGPPPATEQPGAQPSAPPASPPTSPEGSP